MYIMDKLINIIKKPYKIPSKIFLRLKSFIEKFNYSEKIFIEKQNQKFVRFNLSREMGLKKLIEIKTNHSVYFLNLLCPQLFVHFFEVN